MGNDETLMNNHYFLKNVYKMERVANLFRTGGNLGLGGFAPGVMVTALMVGGKNAKLIPPAALQVLNQVPMIVWGAGAGYAFGLPGEDPTCSALKGAAGTVGMRIVLNSAGF